MGYDLPLVAINIKGDLPMQDFALAFFALIGVSLALLIIFLKFLDLIKNVKFDFKMAFLSVGASLLVSGLVVVVTIDFGQLITSDIIWLLAKGISLMASGLYLVMVASKK